MIYQFFSSLHYYVPSTSVVCTGLYRYKSRFCTFMEEKYFYDRQYSAIDWADYVVLQRGGTPGVRDGPAQVQGENEQGQGSAPRPSQPHPNSVQPYCGQTRKNCP